MYIIRYSFNGAYSFNTMQIMAKNKIAARLEFLKIFNIHRLPHYTEILKLD